MEYSRVVNMGWFLDSRFMTFSEITLAVQIVAFVILLYGITNAKHNIPKHGKITTFAFIIAVLSILFMINSLLKGFFVFLPMNFKILLFIHILLGFTTLFFGIVFISNQWRWKLRTNMRIAFMVWLMALGSGILFYLILVVWTRAQAKKAGCTWIPL